jgi:hypothetical protein
MAEAAEVDDADAIDCGRAVDRPDMGSAFEVGHKPRGGFFLVLQPPSTAGEEGTPLDWVDAAEMVELEDAEDASEVEEAGRWTLFRGIYILNSSPLTEFRPLEAPLGALHPVREMGWKLGGGATAVICEDASERLPFARGDDYSQRRGHPRGHFLALAACDEHP